MDYALQERRAGNILGNQVDYAALGQNERESAIQRLQSRIESINKAAWEVGSKLRDHADALYGTVPEGDAKGKAVPQRSGQFGALEDAIDRLDETMMFVAAQAARNCTLG